VSFIQRRSPRVINPLATPPPAGGAPTTYLQSVDGALTMSGALVLRTQKNGLAGTLTAAGAVVKQTGKVFAGALTAAGTLVKQTAHNALSGTLTSAATLVKQTQKVISGSLTMSGALTATKVALLSIAGTLTSSGALQKQTNKILAGALTSSGALVKQTGKILAGALTSSGALVKQTNKILAGTLSSSGTLTAVKAALLSLAGALTSSGALTKQDQKNLSGALTASGLAVKSTQTHLSGTLTSSGAVSKRIGKILAGALTSSGALVSSKIVLRAIAGTLTSAGALTKQVSKGVAGSLATAGLLQKRANKVIVGALTSAGTVAKRSTVTLVGALTALGTLAGVIVGLGPAFIRFVNETLTRATIASMRTVAGYLRAVLSNEPLSYWRLNDAGPTMTDSVGSHDGVVSGHVTTQQLGATGDRDAAILVTNDDGGLSAPSNVEAAGFTRLNGTSTISLEAWFNIGPASLDPALQMNLLTFVDPSNPLSSLGNLGVGWIPANGLVPAHWWAFGELRLTLSDHSIGSVAADTEYTTDGPLGPVAGLETGQWVHIVFTFDGTLGILYLNGTRISSDVPFPVPGAATIIVGDRIRIGSDFSPNDASSWTGLVDDVAVYPMVLTADDVSAHYAAHYAIHVAAMVDETMTAAT
jgi:hypothetical protein